MRTSLSVLAGITALSHILTAQPANSETPIYTSTVSYNVPDETRGPYETWLKDKFRRFADGIMKEDPALRAVVATRVIFGGVKEPEANAFVTYATEGIPKPRPPLADKVSKQLFDKSYADFIAEARPLRKRLGQTLSRRWAGTPPDAAEGDILRFDFKRITPGRMGDYIQLERDYERLRAAQVKAGTMKGWSMSTLVLPAGSDRDYDAYTVHIGKDLEQVLNWGRGTPEIAAKLDPPLNLTGMAMRANDLQKLIRGETRVVVLVVRRP